MGDFHMAKAGRRPTAIFICRFCDTSFERERFRAAETMYCSTDCYFQARANWIPAHFWARTRPGANGCIEWCGRPLTTGGYGVLRVKGVFTKAHRHAWAITNGLIPQGLFVLHRCDNPICVNPEHLFLGTAFDNMQDMAAKGRAAGSRRVGEKHPLAKLSSAQVREIRARFRGRAPGCRANSRELAAEYGVSADTISGIGYRQTRKEVDREVNPAPAVQSDLFQEGV